MHILFEKQLCKKAINQLARKSGIKLKNHKSRFYPTQKEIENFAQWHEKEENMQLIYDDEIKAYKEEKYAKYIHKDDIQYLNRLHQYLGKCTMKYMQKDSVRTDDIIKNIEKEKQYMHLQTYVKYIPREKCLANYKNLRFNYNGKICEIKHINIENLGQIIQNIIVDYKNHLSNNPDVNYTLGDLIMHMAINNH